MSFNCLKDLNGIQYANLSRLTMLKLNNNELSKIEFLDNLKNLKDLDLSCNKIRQIDQ